MKNLLIRVDDFGVKCFVTCLRGLLSCASDLSCEYLSERLCFYEVLIDSSGSEFLRENFVCHENLLQS